MRPDFGSRRSTPRPSVVLPEPLSPISAIVSPACRSKLAPSTARTLPAAVLYSTHRSRTDRIGSPRATASASGTTVGWAPMVVTPSGSAQPRIENIFDPAAGGPVRPHGPLSGRARPRQFAWLQQYYDYHWAAIGNLGVDLLVIPLGKLFGLEAAVKLIVIAIPPLTAIGFLWVAREVHGRIPPTVFLALPFIYGHPFMFGFVNFALSVALAFLAFGLWLRLGRLEKTKLRGWLFVPISLIVFFAHTYGWGLLGLMCFSADAVRLHDRGRSWFRAGFEAALHTSVMAFPLLIMAAWRSETHGGMTIGWFEWKIKWQWFYGALRDRWAYFDMASLAFVGMMFVAVLFSRQLTLSRNLAFSAIVLAIAYIILPRIIFGSAYADMRLVPYLIAVVLLAIRFRGEVDMRTARLLAMPGSCSSL